MWVESVVSGDTALPVSLYEAYRDVVSTRINQFQQKHRDARTKYKLLKKQLNVDRARLLGL